MILTRESLFEEQKVADFLVRGKSMLKDWAENKVTNASEKIACKVLGRKQKELVRHRLIPEHQSVLSFFWPFSSLS